MRVLHATDVYRPQVGGIEIFVGDLAGVQSDRHQVTVLTATPDRDRSATDPPVTIIRRGGPGPVRFLPRRHRLDVTSYDVVHAHLSVFSPFATGVARAAALTGVPTVLTVHSLWSGRSTAVRAVGAAAGWQRWPVVWTAVSSVAATDVRRLLPQQQVTVVPNAVDVDWWRPAPGPRVREEGAPVTIVAVMRLADRKRPLPLVGILDHARRLVPPSIPLRAVIVGDGPLAGSMATALRRLGMADWVSMSGYLSRQRIRDLYRTADLHVAPAYRESFGIAALEARAAGVPVVAMRSGGVGEFLVDGVEGLLCRDDDAMAHAIAHLATSPAELDSMAARNRAVTPGLAWSGVVDRFDLAYAHAADMAGARQVARGAAYRRVRSAAGTG